MAKGTWKQGGSGKGTAKVVGCDLSNLENVDFSKPIESCNSCEFFEGMINNILVKCPKMKKKNTRKFDTEPCEEWKYNEQV